MPMWTSVLMFTYMVIMFKELVGDTCPDLSKVGLRNLIYQAGNKPKSTEY